MPILLKPNIDPKPARPYPLNIRDRAVLNEIYDALYREGKMEYVTQPTNFSYPVFVVWKDTPSGRKGKVVINIRGLNKITLSDFYLLLLQSDIIQVVVGAKYITIINMQNYFHQFWVKQNNKYKLTVISYKN